MNLDQSQSNSPTNTLDAQKQKTIDLPNDSSKIHPPEDQTPKLLIPYLDAIDSSIMRKTLLGNHPKKINFCDTNISKRVLKTRDFQEFQQQSMEDSDIKTPLSQEINENNIFDQITLKTEKVKQNERHLRFSKDKNSLQLRSSKFKEDAYMMMKGTLMVKVI